jgi:uncharacterized membrane protein YphA (DoxX/SURF4 family)
MEVLIFIGLLVIGGSLNFIKKAGFKFVCNLATAYIFIALLISIPSWFFYNATINQSDIKHALQLQITWTDAAGHLIIGYLLIGIFNSLTSAESGDPDVKKLISLTLWGITILTGCSFISESYWKANNFCKMISFFTGSGYGISFLYFIMVAEALGGLGILLHYKLKTGPPAAAGLMIIMIGALYTHNHNNDHLSASYGAISEFITLSLLQVIYYFEQAAKPRPLNLTLTRQ